MMWPGDHRPSISRGINTSRINARSRKMKSSLLSKFLILNRPRARANSVCNSVYSGYGKDLSGSAAMTFHETRRVQKTKTSLFCYQDDLIFFFFNRLRVTHVV